MLDVCRLRNTVRNYDWGSRTALAELLGRPSPSSDPEAELWMGAHATAPSEVWLDNDWISLRELLKERPEELLGRRDAAELPFLFKVLAVARPLSIQAHPDRRQAVEGCRREDRAGIPRGDKRRRYPDDQPKPEILYALETFRMLRGFRSLPELLELLRRLDLGRLLPAVAAAGERGGIEQVFRLWMDLGADRLEEFLSGLGDTEDRDDEAYWLRRLQALHPGDPGVLAPIFLHLHRLERGEAVYTPPRVLHAYLEGVGVELMTNSDNVVRGGLTSKPRDTEELGRVLSFRPDPPRTLASSPEAPGVRRFALPDTALALDAIDLGDGTASHAVDGVEILLSTEGAGRLIRAGREPLEIRRGDAFLVPAAAGSYRLEGSGRLFRAGVS